MLGQVKAWQYRYRMVLPVMGPSRFIMLWPDTHWPGLAIGQTTIYFT